MLHFAWGDVTGGGEGGKVVVRESCHWDQDAEARSQC